MAVRSRVDGRTMLLWSTSLALLTSTAGYAYTVGTGSLPHWMPFISETPLHGPVSTWFKIGLSASALGFVPVALWVHEGTRPIAAELGRGTSRLNDSMLVLALIGSAGLIAVAHFDWMRAPDIHLRSAALFFGTQVAWASATTAIVWRGTEGRADAALRVRAAGALGATALLTVQVFVMWWTEQIQLERMPRSAFVRTTGENLAAFFEWCVVLALAVHAAGLWSHRLPERIGGGPVAECAVERKDAVEQTSPT